MRKKLSARIMKSNWVTFVHSGGISCWQLWFSVRYSSFYSFYAAAAAAAVVPCAVVSAASRTASAAAAMMTTNISRT